MNKLKFKSARFWPLFSNLFFSATLELDSENAYYFKKRLIFSNKEETVKIKDIAFFDTSGIFNKTIDFGYIEQISIKGISKKQSNVIKKHFSENGAKIAHEGKIVKSIPIASLMDLIKPFKWFLREKLVLTEEAVIFIKRKLFSNKTTYLPYNKISFGYLDGIFSKNVYIIGEQNIMSDYSFKNKAVRDIKESIKEKGIDLKNGKNYRPFWFSSFRNIVNPPRIFCTENEIAYIDIVPFKDNVIKVLRYNEIITYRKSKWYSLLGSIIISGDIGNIRGESTLEYSREIKKEMSREKPVIKDKDMDNDIIILLKNVWFYRWRVFFFSVGISKKIKNNK